MNYDSTLWNEGSGASSFFVELKFGLEAGGGLCRIECAGRISSDHGDTQTQTQEEWSE